MIRAMSVRYNTITDRDDSVGRLVDEAIREIQTEDKGKIIDVKLTSTGDHVYTNIVALILYEAKDGVK